MNYSVKSIFSGIFLIGLVAFPIYECSKSIQITQRMQYERDVRRVVEICENIESKVDVSNFSCDLSNIRPYLEANDCQSFISLYNQNNPHSLNNNLCED